jgi:hypothetical protein
MGKRFLCKRNPGRRLAAGELGDDCGLPHSIV